MKIHEYQAKEILRKHGVATPRGIACFSVDEAVAAAQIEALDPRGLVKLDAFAVVVNRLSRCVFQTRR